MTNKNSQILLFERRKTHACQVGSLCIGSDYPYILQSMTNTQTTDISATVTQCKKLFDAGADIVRITAQNKQEAESLQAIIVELKSQGYQKPIVADVHYLPEVAEIAAQYVQKVRINPGNYFHKSNIDDFSLFKSLLSTCKTYHTAIRIGVNQGSLHPTILEKYGDTLQGMVMSAIPFLEVCQQEHFQNVVVSLKSSNTRTMIYANRLLVDEMNKRQMTYPIHLGVTEAGDGEDGRIKSAVGIGTLLSEGIGDTLRVSLTESPENEIPVAKEIVQTIKELSTPELQHLRYDEKYNQPYQYSPRETIAVNNIGGKNPFAIVANLTKLQKIGVENMSEISLLQRNEQWQHSDNSPDAIFIGSKQLDFTTTGINLISEESEDVLFITNSTLTEDFLTWLERNPNYILVYKPTTKHPPIELKQLSLVLQSYNITNPVIVRFSLQEQDFVKLQIKLAVLAGRMLVDGFGNGIMISPPIECYVKQQVKTHRNVTQKEIVNSLFSLLQAARIRIFKTEYIACPSCGRTQYDISLVLQKIRSATQHLKGLKIAVMGCMVNGPGEMADADYGYIGIGKGKVALYKGKTCILQAVDESEAIEKLITIIKENGDWQVPQTEKESFIN